MNKIQKAEALKAAVIEQHSYGFAVIDGERPLWDTDEVHIVDNSDGVFVTWEGGPYQWSYSFPDGGIDEEFGGTIKPVELPKALAGFEGFDRQTSYSLVVY